ncbi:hypothetical protein SH580_06120 [Coraliomargarita algicola]|uniref:Glycosyl hydrolase family 95 catalytic domain-containing protein n=1 Tax=Coraliomargarita algicola TaxID=3092156 RepID=A0ABZ0RQW6_9BACT|nr:hypothetical protein [Coraliomargarita sp. J2-16]WPJ97282.1 hypothetical protein SH580_06120 [Coraliomargarita sp. J2-16]
MKHLIQIVSSALFLLTLSACSAYEDAVSSANTPPIDWPSFIGRQDMKWENEAPTDWLQAPYLGNGMLGLMLFQEKAGFKNPEATNDKNVLSLHVGRGDYNDNRPPVDGRDHTWIYRGRLPIGFYRIRSKGDVTGVDWRLDLWNAKLVGTVQTSVGSYQIESVVHAEFDSFYFKVTAEGDEAVDFEWQPQEAHSYPRRVCDRNAARKIANGEEVTGIDKGFTSMPYPKAPEVEVSLNPNGNISRQELYAESGELITAWKVIEDTTDRSKTLVGSIAFSQAMGEALPQVKADMRRGLQEVEKGTYLSNHERWWNAYYPQSFVSISDDFWEQFYWLQMYKFASATRSNGMMLDVMGPWYQPGFWPMIWTDLNVQLTYWTHLTANRLEVGASLVNKTDQYTHNLITNVPEDWREDCLNAGTIFPADMVAPVGKSVADHMIWLLHDYWLQCRYADNANKMRDDLFPLLKRALNTNLRYIEEHPIDLGDGNIHFKNTWSPEYPGGRGVDINYTIALTKWAAETLLDINREHQLNDPKAAAWQHLLDNLTDYQVDETGLRIGRDIPFDKAHRHYSHLLAFYPLYDLTPDKDRDLLKRSVDHWLRITQNLDNKKDTARSVTGYTCTGAASMYASLNDGDTALSYLRMLPFNNVSCTTMYAEGNPVIESPFSAATAIHDMLLQSWGDTIRIMPGVPSSWKDAHFRSLLCQGGATVSADRSEGQLIYVQIDSPKRARQLTFKMEMLDPQFAIIDSGGIVQSVSLRTNADGFYQVELPADTSLRATVAGTDLAAIHPVKSSVKSANIFGLNSRYEEVVKGFKKER